MGDWLCEIYKKKKRKLWEIPKKGVNCVSPSAQQKNQNVQISVKDFYVYCLNNLHMHKIRNVLKFHIRKLHHQHNHHNHHHHHHHHQFHLHYRYPVLVAGEVGLSNQTVMKCKKYYYHDRQCEIILLIIIVCKKHNHGWWLSVSLW